MILGGLVIMTACNPENANEQLGIPEGGLMLSVEKYSDHNNTKTSVQDNSVQWVGDGSESVRLNGSPYIVNISGGKAYVNASELADVATIRGYYAFNTIADEGTNTPTVEIPATYVSSMVGDRQVIALPMVAYRTTKDNAIQFKHVTAAIKVLVKNTTGFNVFLDSIIVSSETQQLCGLKTINLTDAEFNVNASTTETNSDKRVKVYFASNSITINNGGSDIKEVQVPILPIAAGDITIQVFTHKVVNREGMPSVNYSYIFQHKAACNALNRNVMATARVEIKEETDNPNNHISEVDHSLFSVAAGKQVRFSKGNLQYIGSAIFPYWQFADNQYDYLHTNGQYISSETADLDHFSWGTTSSPFFNRSQYGPTEGDLSGEHEWGNINIRYSGTGEWYTPSKDNWRYLFNRATKWGYATVCSVYGIILLPDDFIDPLTNSSNSTSFQNNTQKDYWTANIYTSDADWNAMQLAGAIFLPAAGCTAEWGEVKQVQECGLYWSSTVYDSGQAYSLLFYGISKNASYYCGKRGNESVRLIQNAE